MKMTDDDSHVGASSPGNLAQQLRVQRRTPRKRLPRREYITFEGIHGNTSAATADSPRVVPPAAKSSKYRGVTRHRSTGRYEAHLWDKSAYSVKQKKKGRQVYLGAYDDEIAAAQAYDLAALKHWGLTATINFKLENYTHQLEEMGKISKEEYLASLRRKSSGFSRGVSKFRGVAQHHHNGRWEARIGRVKNNKYLYLGTFATQEEAARAYDEAAIKHRGVNAVTNFALSRYINDKPSEEGPSQKKVTRIRPKRNVVKSQEHHHVGSSSSVQVNEEINMPDHPQASSKFDSENNDSLDLPEVKLDDDAAEKTDILGVLESNSKLFGEMSEFNSFLESRHDTTVPDEALQLEAYYDEFWDGFDIPPMDDKLLSG